MIKGRNQHVVPRDDGWAVKPEGGQRASSIHGTQREAIDRGREVSGNQQHLAQERLREMRPDFLKRLRKIEEQIEADPKNLELRKEKKTLDQIIGWLVKDTGRRAMRDALRRPPGKSKMY